MRNYMINIALNDSLTEEFIALIPKQRKHIDELMEEGKIIHYALAFDRSQLWVTVSAESKKKAMDIVNSFPLIDFMNPVIFELAFHNSVSNELPKLIMN